jgi:hypothetical protein
MHEDHGIFERGMVQYRIMRLRFFAGEPRQKFTGRCAPLYYNRGRTDKNLPGCYYFWNFDANEGCNFLALQPSEIVDMELTEDSYSLEDIDRSRQKAGHVSVD